MAFYDEGSEVPYPVPVPLGQRGKPRGLPGLMGARKRLRPLALPGLMSGQMNNKAALLAALQAGVLPGGGGQRPYPMPQIQHQGGGGGADWGGQHYNDPMALWQSEVQHGARGTFENFYQQHPGLQNKFDLAVTPPGGRRPRRGFAAMLRAAKGRRPYPMPMPNNGGQGHIPPSPFHKGHPIY